MKRTIAETIYQELREQIIYGTLQTGAMLGEQEVADRYSSSKMPVREALHHLCQEGYLISYPRRGYVVSNITLEDFAEVQQVRTPLELLSVELIVQHASDADIRTLYSIIDEPPATGWGEYWKNSRFHLALARLSGNKRLYASLEHLIGEVFRAAFRFYPDSVLREQGYHRDIIEALLARDTQQAKEMLLRDLQTPHYKTD
jgi:Transcriptional regulators